MDEMAELGFQSVKTIPSLRNTSPSRQKVFKTKPRGLDEDTAATFGKVIHADVLMDESVWGMLPHDVLVEVLARLPPFMIFRMRAVCRKWSSILNDSSFIRCHAQVPSHGPCLLTFWRNSQSQTLQCSVFSLPMRTWYRIPFMFLPDWAIWLVGSSGGLVCFCGYDGLTFKTLVCNPLTQAWRTLPSMHYNQHRQFILVVNRVENLFKVIGVSDIYGDKTLPTEVYDSRLDRWTLHRTMPAVNSSKMAFCDSRLYLETLSPLGLMMYRVDAGKWEHIPAKFPRSLLDGYLVAGAQKRLFLVGRLGLYSTLQSMRIWELDHAKTAWVEISRMPPKYFRALLRLSAERFECFGQDNLICFTSWNQGKGLLYDVDKRMWSWITFCALQLCNSQACFYEPRFDTSIN